MSEAIGAERSALAQVQEIVDRVEYSGHNWRLSEHDRDLWLQIVFYEEDIETGAVGEQHGRKWRLSEHMTDSEVVRTMFAAAMASAEHEVREHFLYRNQRVFGPHIDVEKLAALCADGATEKRL